MTTIKIPQTVSHSKNNNSHGGHGFIALLLVVTWIIIGSIYYGVKNGMIQSEEINPAVSEKISALESNVSTLDNRLKVLEKRLSDASSALNPVAQPQPMENVVKPESAIKPGEASPAAPMPAAPDAGAAMSPAIPQVQMPQVQVPDLKMEEKAKPEDKTGGAQVKPQTDNSDKSDADKSGLIEKKSSI